MCSLQKKVDIIIPVYNAYERLIICIDSVISCTDLGYHRLIFLDDYSSDERVREYLKRIENDNIIVVSNKCSIGLSASINHGITMSSNDVIVLNPDTVVTNNWLNKLQRCAYTDETIGTVMPISDMTSFDSILEPCKGDQVLQSVEINHIAELVENVSLKKYPEIPVTYASCMYVKRSLIDRIGTFNADIVESEGVGVYDFCFRALEVGFHHVLCDNTFVYCPDISGVMENKENNEYLFANYPVQMRYVREYCRFNCHHVVHENLQIRLKIEQILKKSQKTILYQVQSDFRDNAADNVGGTQLHVKDLTMGLRKQYNIVVVARNQKWLNVTLYSGEEEICLQFFVDEPLAYMPFRSKKFRKIYDQILLLFRVDLIHIHHVCGLTLELYYSGKSAGIPIITTLHDFYYLCPNIKMLDYKDELCIYQNNSERCAECIKKTKNIMPSLNYIEIWRQEHLEVLKMSSEIVVPSISTKEIVANYYPVIKSKIRTISHGLKRFDQKESNLLERKTKTFNIAFLGGVGTAAKGANTIYQLIKHGSKEIHWYIFGGMGHCDLQMLEQSNYTKIGHYERKDIPQLMRKYEIDLVGILPIWPETFCYTLSESVLCGIPVIATDIGAIGERMHADCYGWIVGEKK